MSAVHDPLQAFLNDLRLAGRSEATLRGYRADLSRWLVCREAAGSDAEAARAYLDGVAPATVARRHSSLAAYWHWLGQQGPGVVEPLADMAQRKGRRLRRVGGSSLPRGVMLEQLSATLSEMLADPHPPLYAIEPTTKRQARMVARRLTNGMQERAVAYTSDFGRAHARCRLVDVTHLPEAA